MTGCRNIAAIKRAVSGRSGHSTLYLSALDNGSHGTEHRDLPENGTEVVKATALDAFFEAEEWPKVDLVNMDVEGAQEDVFQGMDRLIQEPAQGLKVYCIDDKEGLLSLETVDTSALVSRLPANSGSVDLFCARQ